MDKIISEAETISGTLALPGDKSIAHRAVILASICQGRGLIEKFPFSGDCLSTLICMASLGSKIDRVDEATVKIQGRGLRGLHPPENVLDAGNSGTTARLLSGLLAGQRFVTVLTGDDSLRKRPMRRVIEPLRSMGACISGTDEDRFAPLTIRGGQLRPIDYVLPVASAQVKSAILLAGLYADGRSVVREPAPTRDHSERMLAFMGKDLLMTNSSVAIEGGGELQGKDIAIPGDFSSAAYFLVAALLVPNSRLILTGVGTNPTRTGLLGVLRRMGADVRVLDEQMISNEPVADIEVRSAALSGINISGPVVPSLIDELPMLAVAATQSQGTTQVKDAAELRVKETDRIAAMTRELRKMGAEIEATEYGWNIEGPTDLHGAMVESHGDHRVAMALAVAALVARGETRIRNAEAAEVSFPEFWDLLHRVCRSH
jgi:3-phosphoshikimate 1-carboxyvinyltransferase